ncbi:MAG: TetR/AcrR family transcriptional regulator [Myxococcota bacterium]
MGKGERTRAAILDRALDRASLDGLEGLSIGVLAREAGMSKSGLFAHFDSKEGLQLEVLRHANERFVARVLAPALRERRGEPRLRAFFEGFLRWENDAFPGGCPIQAAAEQFDRRPGPVHDHLVESQRDLLETAATIVRAGMEAGDFRADVDPREVAFDLLSLTAGYHRNRALLPFGDVDRWTRAAFERLLDELRA